MSVVAQDVAGIEREPASFEAPMPPPIRSKWLGRFGLALLVLIIVIAAFGNNLAPHDPTQQNLLARLQPPGWNEGGSWAHPLGTDQLGRDMLSLLMTGARTTLLIALIGASIEAVVGLSVGIVAGYVGGRIERVLMQWTEIQMAFPSLLIIITMVLVIGNDLPIIILALAINGWMIFARVSRTAVKTLRTQAFVEAAIGAGANAREVMARHILPHLRVQIAALFLLEAARLILAESGASFLGLGVQPPDFSWGLILGSSRSYIPVAYHMAFFPGLAIVLAVMSLNVVSRWIALRMEGTGGD